MESATYRHDATWLAYKQLTTETTISALEDRFTRFHLESPPAAAHDRQNEKKKYRLPAPEGNRRSQEAADQDTAIAARPNNIPLPTELRLQILGYLFQADSNHGPNWTGTTEHKKLLGNRRKNYAHTYRFPKELSLVSKDMSRDAFDALHTTNAFILITGRSGWLKVCHDFSVPFVCVGKSSELEFSHWSLRVHIDEPESWQLPDQKNYRDWVQKKKMLDTKLGVAAVILEQDLPVFCEALAFYLRLAPQGPIIAPNGRAQWIAAKTMTGGNTQLSFHFRSPHTTLSVEVQRQLLAPFRKCIHTGLKVTFLGHHRNLLHDIISLQQLICPRAAHMDAMAWDFVVSIERVYDHAQTLYNQNNFKAVAHLATKSKRHMIKFLTVVERLAFDSDSIHVASADIIVGDIMALGVAAQWQMGVLPYKSEAEDIFKTPVQVFGSPVFRVARNTLIGGLHHLWLDWFSYINKAAWAKGRVDLSRVEINLLSLSRQWPEMTDLAADADLVATVITNPHTWRHCSYDEAAFMRVCIRDFLCGSELLVVALQDGFSPKTNIAYEYELAKEMVGWVDKGLEERLESSAS